MLALTSGALESLHQLPTAERALHELNTAGGDGVQIISDQLYLLRVNEAAAMSYAQIELVCDKLAASMPTLPHAVRRRACGLYLRHVALSSCHECDARRRRARHRTPFVHIL
jgi:hypothetical protein